MNKIIKPYTNKSLYILSYDVTYKKWKNSRLIVRVIRADFNKHGSKRKEWKLCRC
jgi:hypothetical protein